MGEWKRVSCSWPTLAPRWWALLLCMGVLAPPSRAEVSLLGEQTPWRVFLTIAPPVEGARAEPRVRRRRKEDGPSPLPPGDWMHPDFDDSGWGCYHGELARLLGGYGYWQQPSAALLCLRGRFGVDDPAKAGPLELGILYRGGVVVYLNGREVARGHLPAGPVEPLTLADDYPAAAYTLPGGEGRLPRAARPASKFRDRYEQRIRRLTVRLPRDVLRKGANVLAVEIHRAALLRSDWSSLGFLGATLTAGGSDGVVPFEQAVQPLRIWNAGPMETVSARQAGKMWYKTSWDRGPLSMPAAGSSWGDPFAPLRPIRLVAARNGAASGQVVVSCADGLKGVSARLGPLRGPGGREVPTGAVQVRYAVQYDGARYCDALMHKPVEGATTQPVWVIVDVPGAQPPGLYAGVLTVRANGRAFTVPVDLHVCDWALPDPQDYASFTSLLQSPDSVAMQYGVRPLSDRHFELMEKSVALRGQIGDDVAFIPVIHGTHMGHRTGLVRWVQEPGAYRPDFGAMERYLDLHAKQCGPPKVVCLIVWKPTLGNQRMFRGVRVEKPEPVVVTRLDPETGRMSDLEAPTFGAPGSEAFWKPVLDGARRVLRKRGWPERRLMLGQAYDSRPLPDVLAFFRRIAPWARWTVFSHWNGDPGPGDDGRLLINGGTLEVGYCESVSPVYLPQLRPEKPDLARRQYPSAGSHRIEVLQWSSPTAWRNIPNVTGTFCRIGLDFWPVRAEEGRPRTIFNTRICGPWLYKAHPQSITAPGPDGAVPTVRFQMLREGVQETEARIAVVQGMQKLSAADRAPYEALLAERLTARYVARVLSQAQISLDWLGLTRRVYEAAGRLAGKQAE